jgi:predicted O-methyltransferase YrrM
MRCQALSKLIGLAILITGFAVLLSGGDAFCGRAHSAQMRARSPSIPARLRGEQLPDGTGTSGGIFNPDFLGMVAPFYNRNTATELMGPLLYSIIRSTRPETVVELGAGYTTFFLAQALQDAAAEAAAERWDPSWTHWSSDLGRATVNQASIEGSYTGSFEMIDRAEALYKPTLHCIDIFDTDRSHYDEAQAFASTAKELGLEDVLKLHTGDWHEWERALPADFPAIDFLWIDGTNPGTFQQFWPRVRADGGLCMLHSTLNNHANWQLICELKNRQASSFSDFELVSLLEPHKWQQNSCTLLRKTSAYDPSEIIVRRKA